MYFVLWLSMSLAAVMTIAAVVDIVTRRTGKRRCCIFVANFNLRFVYMLFFEFFLCSMLHLVSRQESSSPQTSIAAIVWISVLLILISLCALVCFVFSRFFVNGPFIKGSYKQKSLTGSFWGVRPLSEQMV